MPISSPVHPDVQVLASLVEEKDPLIREVTAYNPVAEQTDSTPCLTASGIESCDTFKKIAASNEFPFGTKLWIPALDTIYEVQDRTNSRFKYRIDLLFGEDEIAEAILFGIKTLEVYPLTN